MRPELPKEVKLHGTLCDRLDFILKAADANLNGSVRGLCTL